ncbi:MAG: hypothetical protein AAGI68_17110 [Planctomycetota bacterium]
MIRRERDLDADGSVLERYFYDPNGGLVITNADLSTFLADSAYQWRIMWRSQWHDGDGRYLQRGGQVWDARLGATLTFDPVQRVQSTLAAELDWWEYTQFFWGEVVNWHVETMAYVQQGFDSVSGFLDDFGGQLIHEWGPVAGYTNAILTSTLSGLTSVAGGVVQLLNPISLGANAMSNYNAYRDMDQDFKRGSTWSDVNWQDNRLRVSSSKTAHHVGSASRVIPLFPEF